MLRKTVTTRRSFTLECQHQTDWNLSDHSQEYKTEEQETSLQQHEKHFSPLGYLCFSLWMY